MIIERDDKSSTSESKGGETADAPTGELVLYNSQSVDWPETLVKILWKNVELTGIMVIMTGVF